MKNLTSHNYKLEEIQELRTYNSKSFRIKGTMERLIMGPFKISKQFFGNILTEFHIKPIHYVRNNMTLGNLDEIASYFGNKNGMSLKEGWDEKADFGWLGWYLKRQKLIKGKGIMLPNYSGLRLPLLLNTTSTFFPDPNPETTSVDGLVERNNAGSETFASLRSGAGTVADDSTSATGGGRVYRLLASTTTDGFQVLDRGIFLFDSSSLPDGATISSATFSFYIAAGNSSNALGLSAAHAAASLVGSTPASNTGLVAADYAQLGSTRYATDKNFADWNTDAYTDQALNATGITNISKTNITKLGTRSGVDLDNGTPAWSSAAGSIGGCNQADVAGTTTDPKLTVIFTSVSSNRFASNIGLIRTG